MKHRLWILTIFLVGCSLAPPYQRPVPLFPTAWTENATHPLEEQWWRRFNDPTLNALVTEALRHNRDLAVTLARVDRAAAAAGQSRSALGPGLAADGSGGETWTSRRIDGGGPPEGREKSRLHAVYLGASWELDLWGKYRNALYGAEANLRASEADLEGARLLVAGSTVKGYFDLLSYDFQVRIADQTLGQRLQALEFHALNEEFGFSSRADLVRAQSEVESARYNLAMARLGRDGAHSALLVLLGRSPDEILRGVEPSRVNDLAALPVAPVLPDGLPSNLLARRPDLRAAEEGLRAAHFDVGVVRADYFPSFSLTGQAGTAAKDVGDFGFGAARSWTYGLSLHLPLDFWTTRFRELMAEAKCREAAATYEKAVQAAFRDIRDALARQALLAEAAVALERQIGDLREAVAKADDRYRNGYSNFLDVLDADRSLFSAQLDWAQTRTRQLQAMVDVCLALGGGWSDVPAESASDAGVTMRERRDGGIQ